MRTSKFITISLPPEQLKTAERLARKQSRTMSELFREGLRRLNEEEQSRPSTTALQEFTQAVRLFREDARRAGLDKLTKREINAEIAVTRKEKRAKTGKSTKRSGK